MSTPPRTLEAALRRGNNNFDLLRLVAALMVIVGHAHALSPRPTTGDLVARILLFDYSGSLAVKIFFFMSGLLVANSLLQTTGVLQFLANRALRIFPGLLACLVVCVLVFGAAFTDLPLSAYFRHRDTVGFVVHNLGLVHLQWRLPGVPFGVNGSLWTLPFEVLCYLFLAVVGGVGILRLRWGATALLAAVVAVGFIAPERLPYFGTSPEAQLLPACFAMGALCALHRSSLPLRWLPALGLWLLVVLSKDPGFHRFAFYLALFYSVLVLATERFVVERLKLPFDASYGVYVYGFPVQQSLYTTFPGLGVHANQALAAVFATGLGIASWYLVEKPAMTRGRRLVKRFQEVAAARLAGRRPTASGACAEVTPSQEDRGSRRTAG